MPLQAKMLCDGLHHHRAFLPTPQPEFDYTQASAKVFLPPPKNSLTYPFAVCMIVSVLFFFIDQFFALPGLRSAGIPFP